MTKRANRYVHGGSLENKLEYNSWRAMKERCTNPKWRAYHRYGGRGITIDPRWASSDGFVAFFADMGKKPTPKHSLDRIDNDGDYTPENCRWSSQTTQVTNSSQPNFIEIDGVKKPVTKWIKEYGMSVYTYYYRINQGLSPIEALTKVSNPKRQVSGLAGAKAKHAKRR